MSYYIFFLLAALIAFLLRLFLAPLPNFTSYGDLSSYIAWGQHIAKNGPQSFYSGVWSDYLPGYLYVLWFISNIPSWLTIHSMSIATEILYKFPSILADLANGFLILLIAKRIVTPKKALAAAIIFLFNPAIFANSTLWGQADSFMTLFLLSSFYFLLIGNLPISAILLGLGQMIKPIALFCLPIYLIYLILQKYDLTRIILYLAIFIIIIIIIFLPFNNSNNIFQFIIERHTITSNQYPYTTVNAINFWSAVGNFWQSDQQIFLGISLQKWGYLFFGSIYLILLTILTLGFKKVYNKTLLLTLVSTCCFFAMYLFLTRMHERHAFFALSFISIILPTLPPLSLILVLTAFPIYLLNLYLAFSQITRYPFAISKDTLTFISILNVAIFVCLLINLYRYATFKKE